MKSRFSVEDSYPEVLIQVGRKIDVVVIFSPGDDRGRFEDRLEMYFLDVVLNQRFAITRSVRAIVGDQDDYDLLRATAPYVRPERRQEQEITRFLSGVQPPALARITWKVTLEKYEVPLELKEVAFGKGNISDLTSRVRNAWLPKTFGSQTYGRFFSVLLWIEEERARFAR